MAKAIVPLLALGLVGVLMLLLASSNAPHDNIGWAGIPDVPIPTQRHAPITDEALAYPGATLVKAEGTGAGWKQMVYRTPDNHRDVLDYYKTHLPENGWTMGGLPNSPDFLRLEAQGDASWVLSLNVGVEVFENGDTGIHLITARSPDITNVPLYPDAREVRQQDFARPGNSTAEGSKSGQENQTDRVTATTYLTNAAPKEVEDFYKMKLVQEYAWRPNARSEAIDSERGLMFGYADIGPYPILTIKATPLDGQTEVTITIERVQ